MGASRDQALGLVLSFGVDSLGDLVSCRRQHHGLGKIFVEHHLDELCEIDELRLRLLLNLFGVDGFAVVLDCEP